MKVNGKYFQGLRRISLPEADHACEVVLSQQPWRLLPKILEIDTFMGDAARGPIVSSRSIRNLASCSGRGHIYLEQEAAVDGRRRRKRRGLLGIGREIVAWCLSGTGRARTPLLPRRCDLPH